MFFVILVSAARRLADRALWLQSPFEMKSEGEDWVGSFTAQWHLNSTAPAPQQRADGPDS